MADLRPDASKDRREFVRVSVDLPLHPKLASLDEDVIPLAGWLTVTALCYCGQNLTDGEFDPAAVHRLARVGGHVGALLVEAGLWHEPGHHCLDCPEPATGRLVVHHFLGFGRMQRASIPAAVRELVYRRDGRCCVECAATDDLTLDHIFPWSRGGSDQPINLRTLCRSCNSRKGAKV
jgi:HNH endonuclease